MGPIQSHFGQGRIGLSRCFRLDLFLTQDFADDMTMDVGQPPVDSILTNGKFLVIDP